MLREEQILHLITSNNCPCWKLFLAPDRFTKEKIIANYNVENIKKDTKDESIIEGSINALQKQFDIYKDIPALIFSIIIKPAPTSNGETVLGPFPFTLNNNSGNGALNGMPGQNQNADMMGYIPKNQMSEMIELMAQKSAFLIEKALFERDRRDFEDDKKLAENELKDLEKKYSNIYNSANSGSKKGIMTAGFKLAKALGFIENDVNLGEVEENEKTETDVNDTPEGKASLKVADFLLSKKLTVADIERINNIVINIVEKKNNTSHGTETNE